MTELDRDDSSAGPPPVLTVAIRMHDVGAHFAGRDTPALARVDVTIPANSATALRGASGAGKSTLAAGPIGLVTPGRSKVVVGGNPIPELMRVAWRQAVVYVQQDSFPFHDTIRSNILLERGGIAEAATEDAFVCAGVTFALAMPDGLDTIIGDNGVLLSGGERVAPARTLAGAPALVFRSERESMCEDADQVILLAGGGGVADPVGGRVTALAVMNGRSAR